MASSIDCNCQDFLSICPTNMLPCLVVTQTIIKRQPDTGVLAVTEYDESECWKMLLGLDHANVEVLSVQHGCYVVLSHFLKNFPYFGPKWKLKHRTFAGMSNVQHRSLGEKESQSNIGNNKCGQRSDCRKKRDKKALCGHAKFLSSLSSKWHF